MFGIDLWHVECNLVTREILGWHVECITYTWDASMTRNVLLWHVSYMNVTCSQHVKYKYLTCFDTWATGNSRVMTRVLHLQHVRYMPKICTISLYYKYLTRFTMWVTIYLHIMTCVPRILQARSSFPFSSVTKGYIFTQTEGSHILSHQREWMHKISRVLQWLSEAVIRAYIIYILNWLYLLILALELIWVNNCWSWFWVDSHHY